MPAPVDGTEMVKCPSAPARRSPAPSSSRATRSPKANHSAALLHGGRATRPGSSRRYEVRAEQLERIPDILRRELVARPDIELAILFGSAREEKLHPSSDIDLAVRTSAPLDAWALGGLASDLGRALSRRVDLIVLDDVRSALLKREIARGILLVGDRECFVTFRRTAFREWREMAPRFRRLTDIRLNRLRKA